MHTPWQTFLAAQGYRFADAGGVLRSTAPAEARTTVESACIDLSHHRLLRFVGPDARTFLQGYLTCDVDLLRADHSLLGAYCNIQGRVVADAIVVQFDGHPALWLHGSLATPVSDSLRKYLAFSKTKPLLEEGWVSLGLFGPDFAGQLPTESLTTVPFREGIAIRVPGVEPRWLLLLPIASAQALWTEYASHAAIGDGSRWDLADVRAFWARITAATTATHLPQMIGLEALGGISFEKGCYLGQEIVARAQHRGQVKRHLARAYWTGDGTPKSGEALANSGRAVGIIVSVATTGLDRGEALLVTAKSTGHAATAAGVTFDF